MNRQGLENLVRVAATMPRPMARLFRSLLTMYPDAVLRAGRIHDTPRSSAVHADMSSGLCEYVRQHCLRNWDRLPVPIRNAWRWFTADLSPSAMPVRRSATIPNR